MRRSVLLLFAAVCALHCSTTKPAEIAGGFYQDVSWSADSRWLAYSRLRDQRWSVFTARADGSGERRISSEGVDASWTAWSPNGSRLAFGTGKGEHTDITIVSLKDATAPGHVIDDGLPNAAPTWSPDGRQLAFVSKRDGK